MAYSSEAAKVRDMPHVMQYVVGRIADVGAGHDKITPDALAFDGRALGDNNVRSELMFEVGDGYFDTIFSSHFLEHIADPYRYIRNWVEFLNPNNGHLVLYLPSKEHYNSHDNPEHLFNWNYDDFMFWFKRSFCGEGKDFRGEHLPKLFELVESGMDVGEDRYSFFVIARRV
jgi:SAM-dependent methyltransferase